MTYGYARVSTRGQNLTDRGVTECRGRGNIRGEIHGDAERQTGADADAGDGARG